VPLRRIGKNEFSQVVAVEYAAGIHAGRTENLDDFLKRRLTRRHHGVGNVIGIDDRYPELLENTGNRGFAAADPTRQSDDQRPVIPAVER
jgi:hypothetical protein